jgi:steroid delta-isomerase-like uncharacterized protein
MSATDNKEQFRRFMEEVVNQKNVAAIDEYMSNDFVEHEDISPFPSTREGVQQFFAAMLEGLPDLTVTIDDIAAEGDKVWARWTGRGTHKGELMGIPATDKEVSFGAIDILGYAEGKAVEHWGLTDTFGLMTQLGVISPPG